MSVQGHFKTAAGTYIAGPLPVLGGLSDLFKYLPVETQDLLTSADDEARELERALGAIVGASQNLIGYKHGRRLHSIRRSLRRYMLRHAWEVPDFLLKPYMVQVRQREAAALKRFHDGIMQGDLYRVLIPSLGAFKRDESTGYVVKVDETATADGQAVMVHRWGYPNAQCVLRTALGPVLDFKVGDHVRYVRREFHAYDDKDIGQVGVIKRIQHYHDNYGDDKRPRISIQLRGYAYEQTVTADALEHAVVQYNAG